MDDRPPGLDPVRMLALVALAVGIYVALFGGAILLGCATKMLACSGRGP